MPRFSKAKHVVVISAVVLASCGCADQYSLTPVEGKVFYNGKPLEFGSVMFQPSVGRPAIGLIQPGGTFELTTHKEGDGAQIGKHKVIVTCYAGQQKNSKGKADNEEGSGLGKLLIPTRYTFFDQSEIEIDVVDECPPVMIELKD